VQGQQQPWGEKKKSSTIVDRQIYSFPRDYTCSLSSSLPSPLLLPLLLPPAYRIPIARRSILISPTALPIRSSSTTVCAAKTQGQLLVCSAAMSSLSGTTPGRVSQIEQQPRARSWPRGGGGPVASGKAEGGAAAKVETPTPRGSGRGTPGAPWACPAARPKPTTVCADRLRQTHCVTHARRKYASTHGLCAGGGGAGSFGAFRF
jgi:hypothetical protein